MVLTLYIFVIGYSIYLLHGPSIYSQHMRHAS
jgi:hypothetical protein